MDTQNQSSSANHAHGALGQLEEFFFSLYKRIPFHLPPAVREFIVKFGPWITLILIIIAIPVVLAALGLTAFLTPFAMMYGGWHMGPYFMVAGLISLGALILEAMALPGLFARSIKGWRLVFYACLLNALGQLIQFEVVGLILGLAISLYILFEIKSYYH